MLGPHARSSKRRTSCSNICRIFQTQNDTNRDCSERSVLPTRRMEETALTLLRHHRLERDESLWRTVATLDGNSSECVTKSLLSESVPLCQSRPSHSGDDRRRLDSRGAPVTQFEVLRYFVDLRSSSSRKRCCLAKQFSRKVPGLWTRRWRRPRLWSTGTTCSIPLVDPSESEDWSQIRATGAGIRPFLNSLAICSGVPGMNPP